jgi:hypothetical protein
MPRIANLSGLNFATISDTPEPNASEPANA